MLSEYRVSSYCIGEDAPRGTSEIMMRGLTIFLALCVACGFSYWAYVRITTSPGGEKERHHPTDNKRAQGRVAVPNNRGTEVVDGFRGDAHPFLHCPGQTEVKAFWVPPRSDDLDSTFPLPLCLLYRNVGAAVPVKTYSERDFVPFLPPEKVRTVGQLWALPPEQIAVFLKQFHPAVSTHLVSVGRRPGPDGAFAVLRGVSSSRLDIVFRIHAEFDLLPKSSTIPVRNSWYTPACFLGRLVVNRTAGTVEYFQIGVPTDKGTNIHVTSWTSDDLRFHITHRVDRMELTGGSPPGRAGVQWTDQITMTQARDKLAALFYKFKDIHFLPFDQALAAARKQRKPILAVVLLGALDDESC
jgi:hypothetical protein